MPVYPGRMYVSNLHFDTSEDDLYEFMLDEGFTLDYVRVPADKNYIDRFKNRGFAFVDFGSAEDAEEATAQISGKRGPLGRPLILKPSRALRDNDYR